MENHATAGAAVDACGVDQRSDEYRLLMAYCGKRKRQRSGPMPQFQGLIQKEGPPPSRHNATFYDTGPTHRGFPSRHGRMAAAGAAGGVGNTLDGVADRLTQIADSVQITPDDIESDGTDDQHDLIRRLVELLKASGDKLNEEIKSNHILQRHLQTSFTYSLFETVTSTLLQGVTGVEGDGPVAQTGYPAPEKEERVQREQIALACEVTSKLSALDLHPMSRAMGFGTRYLQEHHTAWVKKHGGWNNVFDSEDTD
ncbi:apoptosis facilitator Bcl-2-like protein 14 isoform X2 [Salvelinus fontinalis]|uniref:apoptosis facilitator Bcl-2-like protein 14 isoform X2 n=1 Tax=Salvelinus fontinalis TaxID=8038 RepID=UPI0024865F1C|nr:apoptosis facilitator Bcl-2-like protein 14 isoform X2 [Salvelinus fontinalis]